MIYFNGSNFTGIVSSSKLARFIFLTYLLLQISCKKFVEVPAPITLLVKSNVFNNDGAATSALTNIYTQMQGSAFGYPESYLMSQYNGYLADELVNYSTDIHLVQYFTNSMSAITTNGPWQRAYNYIYQSNAILEGLQTQNGVSAAAKRQLLGESKFIRAFWHFYLTNLYGDVPLVLNTDYSVNASIIRTSRQKIYLQVISDLNDAKELLSDNYVDASDTATTLERVRPSKWTACAMLARVYLYNNNYLMANQEATQVINNIGMYSLESNLNKVFLANSSEAIWQVMTPKPFSNGATPDGLNFILTNPPSTDVVNCSTISSQLMNSFENGDKRKDNWVGSISVDSVVYYYPNKYKVYQSSDATEYVMVLRLSEQYLIRAEANAELNEIDQAKNDLNVIRNRAGLINYSGLLDSKSLLSAIMHERQTELFSEWGHRWFDLNRTGNVNQVMDIVAPLKGGVWDINKRLYPIPQSERVIDPSLTQNAGY